MRELDACGIGFVADAEGRPSRSIVTSALEGLANVKHRGAVAADARTSDGTGLLTTIPPAIFGEGTGVVALFIRGDDPTAAVEAAAAEEGLEVTAWREPPTDDTVLGDLAARTRPRIVQALVRPTAATARGVSTNGRPAGCSGGTAALTRPMTWPTPVGWGVPGGVGRRATGSSYLFECDGGVCRSC